MPGQRAVALLPCVICAVHCRQTLADKHRLLAENERLESVVQQWTQRAKGYIGESTKATAELYKRDQLLAKVGTSNQQASNRTPRLLTPRAWRLQSKKRVEDLEKQLAVQTEIVEHFAQEKTNIHTQAEVRLAFHVFSKVTDTARFTVVVWRVLLGQRDEKAMDGLAEEYSLLSARSEAQFERDAKQIAVRGCCVFVVRG